MNRSITLLPILVLSFLFTACDNKQVARRDHEQAIERNGFTNPNPRIRAHSEKLRAFDVDQLESLIREESLEKMTSEEIKSKIIGPIQAGLLLPEVLENPDVISHLDTIRLIRIHDTAYYHILKNHPDSADKTQLKNYYDIVSYGCTQKLTECKFISLYRRSSYSALILNSYVQILDKELGKQTCKQTLCNAKEDQVLLQKVKSLFDVILIAFQTKNRYSQEDLEFVYMKRFRLYNYYLLNQFANEKGVPVESISELDYTDDVRLVTQLDLFETIINEHKVKNPYSEEFQSFIENFNPWNYSAKRSSPLHKGVERMFEFASKYYLYDRDNRDQINPSLKASIVEYQTNGTDSEKSFYQELTQLKNDNNQYLTNFGIDSSEFSIDKLSNEYFFIIDRLYNEHISENEAQRLWAYSKKDREVLVEWIIKYIRVEFVKSIIKTNELMKGIYQAEKFSNKEMFRVVINESYIVNGIWDKLIRSSEKLYLFARAQIPTYQQNFDAFRNLQDLSNHLKKNIKVYSVFPNMIVLSYFLTALDSKMTFKTWFGLEIEVDPTTVISYMFEGGFRPWFDYAKDLTKLDKGQIIIAYYFILLAESFDTFKFTNSETGEESINKVKFFKKVLGFYTDPIRTEIEKQLREFRKQYLVNNTYQQFLEMCHQPENYEVLINYMDLSGNLMADPGSTDAPLGSALSLYGYGKLNTLLEMAFGEQNKLTLVKTLIQIYRRHLERNGEIQGELKSELEVIEKIVKDIDDLRDEYLGTVFYLNHEISTCVDKIHDMNRKRLFSVLRDEIDYLKDIYKAAQTHKEGLTKDVFESEVGPLLGADKIEYPYYMLSKYGVLERVKQRLNSTTDDSTYYKLTNDTGFRTKVEDLASTDNIDFINQPKYRRIKLDASETEFVRDGIRNYTLVDSSLFAWMKPFTQISTFGGKEIVFQHLYKLGDIKIPKDLANKNPAICKRTENDQCYGRISADELLETGLRHREILSLSEDDLDILYYFDTKELILKKDLEKFIIHPDNHLMLPTYQRLFRGVLADYGGAALDGSGPLKDAERIGRSLMDILYLVFPPHSKVCTTIHENYSKPVNRHFDNIKRMVEAVSKRKEQDKDRERIANLSYEIEIGPDVASSKLLRFPYDDNELYLKDRDLRDVEGRERRFHLDSKDYFKGDNAASICQPEAL